MSMWVKDAINAGNDVFIRHLNYGAVALPSIGNYVVQDKGYNIPRTIQAMTGMLGVSYIFKKLLDQINIAFPDPPKTLERRLFENHPIPMGISLGIALLLAHNLTKITHHPNERKT